MRCWMTLPLEVFPFCHFAKMMMIFARKKLFERNAQLVQQSQRSPEQAALHQILLLEVVMVTIRMTVRQVVATHPKMRAVTTATHPAPDAALK